MEDELSSRRPLKSRGTRWAQAMAGRLATTGITPNQISAFSVVAAGLGAAAFLAAGSGHLPKAVGWAAGAACIQIRLICNLMDGMVAIEGGKKSATGDIWNELPDRFADTLFLAAAGWAAGVPWAGALAAWASVMTAYVRALGGTITGTQDFRGPFAKQHRMAILTLASLMTAAEGLWGGHGQVMAAALWLLAAGTCLLVVLRTRRLATTLKSPSR